jgi:hypothetical protein
MVPLQVIEYPNKSSLNNNSFYFSCNKARVGQITWHFRSLGQLSNSYYLLNTPVPPHKLPASTPCIISYPHTIMLKFKKENSSLSMDLSVKAKNTSPFISLTWIECVRKTGKGIYTI